MNGPGEARMSIGKRPASSHGQLSNTAVLTESNR